MKIYKILYLFAFAIVFYAEANAQALMKFTEPVYDFGKVAEGTQASHEFKFKNEGNAPLIISQVQASCGCTTPFWTKDPVLPGNEGVITASYNSNGRPGAFNKSIIVQSNSSEGTVRVYIKGVVVPVSEAGVVYSKEEMAKSPRVSAPRYTFNLGKVEKGQPVPVKITLENTGHKNLVIADFFSNCNCVVMSAESSSVIHPGEKGTLELIYKPQSIGVKTEVVNLMTNDLHNPETRFTLKAEVVETLRNTSILQEGSGISF